jgi:hypothetical protein
MTYDPTTISAADLYAVMGRVGRYLARHGAASGETPLRPDMAEDVHQSIMLEWQGDDWTAREFEYLARTGRTLFPPTLSELGQHLRAALFHAGRARVRHWRQPGQAQGSAADHRRRGLDDSKGAGMASRSADPALIVAAVESASGQLVLSRAAARGRSRRGLPLAYRGRLSAIHSADSDRRARWFKTRNSKGRTIDVVARHADRTDIAVTEFTRFNFERRGTVGNRVMPRTVKHLPAGTTAAMLREGLTG